MGGSESLTVLKCLCAQTCIEEQLASLSVGRNGNNMSSKKSRSTIWGMSDGKLKCYSLMLFLCCPGLKTENLSTQSMAWLSQMNSD